MTLMLQLCRICDNWPLFMRNWLKFSAFHAFLHFSSSNPQVFHCLKPSFALNCFVHIILRCLIQQYGDVVTTCVNSTLNSQMYMFSSTESPITPSALCSTSPGTHQVECFKRWIHHRYARTPKFGLNILLSCQNFVKIFCVVRSWIDVAVAFGFVSFGLDVLPSCLMFAHYRHHSFVDAALTVILIMELWGKMSI